MGLEIYAYQLVSGPNMQGCAYHLFCPYTVIADCQKFFSTVIPNTQCINLEFQKQGLTWGLWLGKGGKKCSYTFECISMPCHHLDSSLPGFQPLFCSHQCPSFLSPALNQTVLPLFSTPMQGSWSAYIILLVCQQHSILRILQKYFPHQSSSNLLCKIYLSSVTLSIILDFFQHEGPQ